MNLRIIAGAAALAATVVCGVGWKAAADALDGGASADDVAETASAEDGAAPAAFERDARFGFAPGRERAAIRHAEVRHAEVRHAEVRRAEVRHAEVRHAEVRHAEREHFWARMRRALALRGERRVPVEPRG
ncbi:MAG TPA: hypothetical protein VGM56_29235 [Byssovorax sp.]|jgi:hypothetical protein